MARRWHEQQRSSGSTSAAPTSSPGSTRVRAPQRLLDLPAPPGVVRLVGCGDSDGCAPFARRWSEALGMRGRSRGAHTPRLSTCAAPPGAEQPAARSRLSSTDNELFLCRPPPPPPKAFLANHAEAPSVAGRSVAELGCGHGLPVSQRRWHLGPGGSESPQTLRCPVLQGPHPRASSPPPPPRRASSAHSRAREGSLSRTTMPVSSASSPLRTWREPSSPRARRFRFDTGSVGAESGVAPRDGS